MNKGRLFHYTVGELIEILSTFPSDVPILTSGYENGFENIQEPVLKDLVHKENAPYYDGEFQPSDEYQGKPFQAIVLSRIVRDD